MKKLAGSRTVRILKRIFKLREWSDFERIKGFGYVILHSMKLLFIPQTPKRSQSKFEDVVVNLQLTDDDLEVKRRALFRWAVLMLVISGCILLYGIYQLICKSYLSFGVSCSLSGIALSFAFRYHFWFYQITQRRLGCSFKEWLFNIFSCGTI